MRVLMLPLITSRLEYRVYATTPIAAMESAYQMPTPYREIPRITMRAMRRSFMKWRAPAPRASLSEALFILV
jgi:hypothetical protein